jgi:hypothetical protein
MKPTSNVIKVGSEEFDVIPQEAVAASKIIEDMYIKLGRPKDPFSEPGQKLMKLMLAVWEDLWPVQAREWYEERKDYQNNEKSITEQVQQRTGRSLASYPLPIYNMMKKVFRGFDAAERENCIKMVKLFPQFRMANKV